MTSYITVRGGKRVTAEEAARIIAASMAADTLKVRESRIERATGRIDRTGRRQEDGTVGAVDTVYHHSSIDKDKRRDVLKAMLDALTSSPDKFKQRLRSQLIRSGMRDAAGDQTKIDAIIKELTKGIRAEMADINEKTDSELEDMAVKGSFLSLMQDALTARWGYNFDEQYTVVGGQIVLTQEMTGVNSQGQRLKGGELSSLHQLLEAKHELIIRGEG
jgi:hypothetical protein